MNSVVLVSYASRFALNWMENEMAGYNEIEKEVLEQLDGMREVAEEIIKAYEEGRKKKCEQF